MLGFILVNEQNSVVYVQADAALAAELCVKQRCYQNDQSTSSGFSEVSTTTGTAGARSPRSVGVARLSSASSSQSTATLTEQSANELELVALSCFFLPLVMLFRAKLAFDGDAYRHVVANGQQLQLQRLNDHFLVIAMADGRLGRSRLQRYVQGVCASLGFCFGALLPYLGANLGAQKSRRRAKMFERAISEIATISVSDDEHAQWWCGCVDVCAFADPYQREVARNLGIIGREFQVFVGTSLCMLVTNRRLAAMQQTLPDDDLDGAAIASSDALLLLRSCNRYWRSKKFSGDKPNVRLGQPWLKQRGSNERTLWDLFRLEVLPGTVLLCLGPSACAPLISHITALLNCVSRFAADEGLAAEMATADRLVRLVCQALVDMVPDEIEDSGEKLHAAQLASAAWFQLKLRMHTVDATVAAEERQELLWAAEASLTQFSNQCRAMLDHLVAKSEDMLRGYKLDLFNKCWNRLNTYKLHAGHTRAMLQHIPTSGFDDILPASLDLDIQAYVFLSLSRRICFSHVPPEIQMEFNQTVSRLLKRPTLLDSEVLLAPLPSCAELVLLAASNRVAVAGGRRSRATRLLGAIARKGRSNANALFADIGEPVACFAVFDAFVHRDLALTQTKRLAVCLQQLIATSPLTFPPSSS